MKKELKERTATINVKGENITYVEKYLVDETGEEIFDRNIEFENDINLFDKYKEKMGLLSSSRISAIRKKYNLTQKSFSLVLGLGEISIHRFEKGSIQTEGIDSIIRLSEDPNNMLFLMQKNQTHLSKETYNSLLNLVKANVCLRKHALINLDFLSLKESDFKESNVIDVSKKIIKIYNDKVDNLNKSYNLNQKHITNLKLQKLLYYVQAISLLIYNKKSYNEKLISWSYGPVVIEAYNKYKNNDNEILISNNNIPKLSNGLEDIIEEVVDTYGSLEATELINFTHEEDPWKETKINSEIDTNLIKKYFEKIYNLNS